MRQLWTAAKVMSYCLPMRRVADDWAVVVRTPRYYHRLRIERVKVARLH